MILDLNNITNGYKYVCGIKRGRHDAHPTRFGLDSIQKQSQTKLVRLADYPFHKRTEAIEWSKVFSVYTENVSVQTAAKQISRARLTF